MCVCGESVLGYLPGGAVLKMASVERCNALDKLQDAAVRRSARR